MPIRLRQTLTLAALVCACFALLAPAGAMGQAPSGGAEYEAPPLQAKKAKIVRGIAIPPIDAPARVKRAIAAANRIVRKPYRYGGGHKLYGSVTAAIARLDRGYDCSGTVSFALFGGKFLKSPLDSRSFARWGKRGKGHWITVYTNPGHAYAVIAGLRLDTSVGDRSTRSERRTGSGPRWRKYHRSSRGFQARHPSGY